MTNFAAVFSAIIDRAHRFPPGSQVTIVFFTDGCDTCNTVRYCVFFSAPSSLVLADPGGRVLRAAQRLARPFCLHGARDRLHHRARRCPAQSDCQCGKRPGVGKRDPFFCSFSRNTHSPHATKRGASLKQTDSVGVRCHLLGLHIHSRAGTSYPSTAPSSTSQRRARSRTPLQQLVRCSATRHPLTALSGCGACCP